MVDYSDRPIEVLHVDDDPRFLDLTQTFLDRELSNLTVYTDSDPTDVTDRIAEARPDCVVSDYDMPEMNGLELLEIVREQYPDLPFLLYTGKGSEEIAAEAINNGVTGYLQKGGPDQHRRLANRIDNAVEKYRATQDSERYSTVLRALGYPVYVVNDNAEFEYVNEPFSELTGYDRSEIIGSKPALIKDEEAVERADNMLASAVSSDGPDVQRFEVDIQTKTGETIPCLDHMAALPFEETFRGSVGILRDISTERERQRELVRKNERLEEFVSLVSHELQTPLANAQTAAELAEQTCADEQFEQLHDTLDHLDRMLEELLTIAKQGMGVPGHERERIALDSLTDTVLDSLGPAASAVDVSFEDEIAVLGEEGRLRRLLENLLSNAAEHAEPPVQVTIGLLDSDDGFYIADDGPGIPEADRTRVFELGYTTTADGTGLGLVIVRRIADAHGWDLELASSDHGGARFEFAGSDVIAPN